MLVWIQEVIASASKFQVPQEKNNTFYVENADTHPIH